MSVDLHGAKWFKSSHSSQGGECVEVAILESGTIGVRDSKHPTGPALFFEGSQWDTFLRSRIWQP